MRIAVLTQPLHRNYGGLLQAYALQTYLEKMGHEVVVVNREYEPQITNLILLARCGSVIKTIIRRFLFHRKDLVIMHPLSPFFSASWSGFDILPFVKKKINHSPILRSSKALRRYLKKGKFDCYIVGSDQVWRPSYSPCITDYFLKEVRIDKNALKIAYAASFGTNQWEFSEKETLECARLAKLFDRISVREKSGVKLCEEYLGVQAQHVLDPTLLLDVDDYISLFEEAKVPKSAANLFCYVLDTNTAAEKIIKNLEEDGYRPTYSKLIMTPTKDNPRPCQLSVEEWLRGIYDSELVITDSFHACVFSIIFKKPFIALGNKFRGNARFDSLFETFGLHDRLVTSYESFMTNKELLVKVFDTAQIESYLHQQRKISNLFLKCVSDKM